MLTLLLAHTTQNIGLLLVRPAAAASPSTTPLDLISGVPLIVAGGGMALAASWAGGIGGVGVECDAGEPPPAILARGSTARIRGSGGYVPEP